MSQTAAHLIDHVVPHVPVLQGVQRMVMRQLLDRAGLKAEEGRGGAVTLVQRSGSAARLNIHLQCLVLDGVHRSDADGVPAFVEAVAPTDDELHALLQTVIARLMKMLTRRGVLVEETGQTFLAEPDTDGDEARTRRCRWGHTTASGWSSCAATSRARHCRTSGCRSTLPGRRSSSPRRPGATARRTG